MSNKTLIGLDVGEKRVGVAVVDLGVRIAVPLSAVEVDGTEISVIESIVKLESAETIVVGFPRNQKGEVTAQTEFVKDFAKKLEPIGVKVAFQDESLTSVLAEQRLIAHKKPYKLFGVKQKRLKELQSIYDFSVDRT